MISLRRWAGDSASREVGFLYIVTLPRMMILGSGNLYICGGSGFVALLAVPETWLSTDQSRSGSRHHQILFSTICLMMFWENISETPSI